MSQYQWPPDTSQHRKPQRDARLKRAIEDVIPNYQIQEIERTQDGQRVFQVMQVGKSYRVHVHPEGKPLPTCTCPDFTKSKEPDSQRYGLCKHAMAVMIQEASFQHLVLELFL